MIFYECYNDEAFLRSLGLTRRELSGGHSFGRSNVSLRLRKASKCIGFVDEDPGKTKDAYLTHIFSLRPLFQNEYVSCFVDPNLSNRLLVVRPDLEGFALRIAKERNIDLESTYDLPNDLRTLHDTLAPQRNRTQRDKFVRFITDIEDHLAIKKLKELIK